MKYSVEYELVALKQLKKLEKSGRKVDINRVSRFIEEIKIHPKTGTGHPEQMKYHTGETWSRKVNKKDRFVYRIFEQEKTILVIQALGHYQDN